LQKLLVWKIGAKVMAAVHSVEIPSRHAASFLRNLEKRCISKQGPAMTAPAWDALEESLSGAPNAWVPHLGTSCWSYEGASFVVTYVEEGAPVAVSTAIYFRRLTAMGQGREEVQAFVAAMLRTEPALDPLALGRVRVWASTCRGEWNDRGFSPAQSLDDLFLPKKSVTELLLRMDAFEAAGERCAATGRMHKMGLLLMGVPGSGKSSLVRALARKYARDLHILTFARRMDDEVCEELIENMGPNGVLLVEDFDSLGFSDSSKKKDCKDGEAHGVTRSFFLNVLDGVLRPPNGTIIFLTSNSCVGLDKALARPGRVDIIVHFREPQEPEIMAALERLTEPEEAEDAAARAAKIAQFCAKLRKLKKGCVCMSGVVDHLFRHPRDYLAAFEELEIRCLHGEELSEEGAVSMYM